jgi:RNA polymerase sigma-70 factor (ECF subfamily)
LPETLLPLAIRITRNGAWTDAPKRKRGATAQNLGAPRNIFARVCLYVVSGLPMSDDRSKPDMEALVAEHYRAVCAYAYRLSGAVDAAEEMTQQVFLIAQQHLDQLWRSENARNWLLAIARNCYLKSRARRRPVDMSSLSLSADSIPAEPVEEDQIDRQRLQEALQEMPEDFRVVLLMFYFEELSYRQIADRLGLPMGTVMSRLARAKQHLRNRLFAAQLRQLRRHEPTPL